jgi:hypothetical protein
MKRSEHFCSTQDVTETIKFVVDRIKSDNGRDVAGVLIMGFVEVCRMSNSEEPSIEGIAELAYDVILHHQFMEIH